MSAAREELVRVDSWGDLRIGMLIVAKGCYTCGVGHRGILTAHRSGGRARDPLGRLVYVDRAWSASPGIACRPSSRSFAFTPDEVADGLIFRVVDGLESDQSHASRRDRLLEEVTR